MTRKIRLKKTKKKSCIICTKVFKVVKNSPNGCQQVVKKVVKKLSKVVQKVAKKVVKKLPNKLSKSCQKVVKSQKVVKKVGKKMTKLKIGCKKTKILKRVGEGGGGEGDL
jgi:hypothetical protein